MSALLFVNPASSKNVIGAEDVKSILNRLDSELNRRDIYLIGIGA